MPCIWPFVSAIGDNSLLIYGGLKGNHISGGLLIDMEKNRQTIIPKNDFSIISRSHGVARRSGAAVGLVEDKNQHLYMV